MQMKVDNYIASVLPKHMINFLCLLQETGLNMLETGQEQIIRKIRCLWLYKNTGSTVGFMTIAKFGKKKKVPDK